MSAPIPLAEQIAELEREIRLREKTYPRWIQASKLNRANAERQMARLKAARDSLAKIKAELEAGGLAWCERCEQTVRLRDDRGDALCARCGLVL